MFTRKASVCALAALSILAAPVSGFAACDAHSGAQTAALVELYTSEGCSSCPPADEQLRHLRDAVDAGATVVPLALHVDYWDSIGWKDTYAQGAYDRRQSWLVRMNGSETVYTPQFFVNGAELPGWRSGLREAVRNLNARPSEVDIHVQADAAGDGAMSVRAEARAHSLTGNAAMYVALAESGLVSRVTRGENGGVTLKHDHLSHLLIGPIPLGGGSAELRRQVALPAAWNRDHVEVVAFVEDESTGKVLQALGAQSCAKS